MEKSEQMAKIKKSVVRCAVVSDVVRSQKDREFGKSR